jgi:hypothetical protein
VHQSVHDGSKVEGALRDGLFRIDLSPILSRWSQRCKGGVRLRTDEYSAAQAS